MMNARNGSRQFLEKGWRPPWHVRTTDANAWGGWRRVEEDTTQRAVVAASWMSRFASLGDGKLGFDNDRCEFFQESSSFWFLSCYKLDLTSQIMGVGNSNTYFNLSSKKKAALWPLGGISSVITYCSDDVVGVSSRAHGFGRRIGFRWLAMPRTLSLDWSKNSTAPTKSSKSIRDWRVRHPVRVHSNFQSALFVEPH
ncbi:hypothetical protein SODALDRAFT_374346 [Sodiomyces alkalinus F11]|uniref:Uncharacterized protein n=1 Tax=Sodiomyces alkalinus (strain CBS 110278 / VKM F-3762 / F11) TaxID=1314773 RepID=A0A3N2Q5I4_SODAK|nr:hypothetical protein SODALDRAFT_374346 [Sodiomyces alkalinus F11]ROT41956.1 hypothetical protein SODALDRAFT_374346 [Sodiomyces alkalinus F11]